MSELPDTWAEVTIGEINAYKSETLDPSKNQQRTYELYSVPIFPTRKPELLAGKEIGSTKQRVEPEDVLLCKINPRINRVWIVGERAEHEQIASSEWIAIRQPLLDANFIRYQLSEASFRERLCAEVSGVGGSLTRAQPKKVEDYTIRIAPLAEQKRIAQKLDALLAQVDTLKARIDAMPALLKRFRRAVLSAAVTGDLSARWRIDNTDVENSTDLLNRIDVQKTGRLRVKKGTSSVTQEILYSIPGTWSWTENYRLAQDSNTAICAGPFGTIFKAKDFREGGVPIIFLRHVKEMAYKTEKPCYMDADVWKDLHQEYSVHGGELLVTKLGDPPGTACLYPNGIGTAMVTPDVIKMNVDERASVPKFLMYFFNSLNCKNLIEEMAFGATRLRIDIAMFKRFPIPLPPLEEQKEIVRCVEQLFAFADQLEAKVATAKQRIDTLTQSLLAKAFRGELVPQDPNDEPASVLLERIRAQRAAAPTPRRGRKPVAVG